MQTLKQSEVRFNEQCHTYTLPSGRVLQGITGLISRQLFPNKYANIPEAVLQKAAERGSLIHNECRQADVFGEAAIPEAADYLQLKSENGIVTIENEFLISDNEYFATQIDMVDEAYNLYDIKTTSVLDEDYLSWQLSICAYLFEKQTGESAGRLFGIWLNKGKFKLVEVKRIDTEMIETLLNAEINGEQFVRKVEELPTSVNDMLIKLQQIEFAIMEIENSAKAYEANAINLREALKAEMEKAGVKKWETDNIVVTYVGSTERRTIDSTRLKAEQPSVYDQYIKVSNINPSIKIKLK